MNKKSWQEFRSSGLLWFINTILHVFGWAIVIVQNEDGSVSDAYPARVSFRGFESDVNDKGYLDITKFINNYSKELMKDLEQK